jgi:CRISPR system Cascade subunit CasC
MTHKTVEAFLRSSITAVPTGKQTSFAAQNPPSFLLAVVRQDGMSWSLANAFEKPVFPTRANSLVENSIAAADKHWGRLMKAYGGEPVPVVLTLDENAPLESLSDARVNSVDEWVNAILDKLPQE